mmetsp:Transcript_25292/g.64121  ORF Transcript_25292/g.64121 Transcript_25292/m.64121 type:complete len:208 (+) Transcript_25292:489-1112(+)
MTGRGPMPRCAALPSTRTSRWPGLHSEPTPPSNGPRSGPRWPCEISNTGGTTIRTRTTPTSPRTRPKNPSPSTCSCGAPGRIGGRARALRAPTPLGDSTRQRARAPSRGGPSAGPRRGGGPPSLGWWTADSRVSWTRQTRRGLLRATRVSRSRANPLSTSGAPTTGPTPTSPPEHRSARATTRGPSKGRATQCGAPSRQTSKRWGTP